MKRKIATHRWLKPILTCKFDWVAWFDDEGEEMGRYGYGATEAEAIADLVENYPDNDDSAVVIEAA
jgi:hypothetical protein